MQLHPSPGRRWEGRLTDALHSKHSHLNFQRPGTCDDVLVNKVKEMLRAEAELKELEQRVVEKKQLIETLKAEIMPDPIPPRK